MVVGDYCCRKCVKYVVSGNDFPAELATASLSYLLGPRLGLLKDAEAFVSPWVSLLRGFHGLPTVQRTEEELGMDFAHQRLRSQAASPHHLIDLGYLGSYVEGLYA